MAPVAAIGHVQELPAPLRESLRLDACRLEGAGIEELDRLVGRCGHRDCQAVPVGAELDLPDLPVRVRLGPGLILAQLTPGGDLVDPDVVVVVVGGDGAVVGTHVEIDYG